MVHVCVCVCVCVCACVCVCVCVFYLRRIVGQSVVQSRIALGVHCVDVRASSQKMTDVVNPILLGCEVQCRQPILVGVSCR
jgi:hypothetical protein